MNQILERFQKLPRSQRLLVAAVAYIAIGALFWFLMIAPNLEQIDTQSTENKKLKEDRNKARAVANDLPRHQAEFEALHDRYLGGPRRGEPT